MSELSAFYHKYIQPTVVKLENSQAFKDAVTVAEAAAVDIAEQAIEHPEWTADDRKAMVIKEVTTLVDEKYPSEAWIINMAITYAENALEAQGKK